ncbi:MAG: O-methyltransferase [Ruminococcaceae bacterium]|nr:O-methyltransferase [Oscillospiraceae bacterium]
MRDWIEGDNINYDYILRYIRDTLPQREGLLLEMEKYAEENSVPISQPESIRFLEIIIKIANAKRILEVGSAIGYSAIRMSRAAEGEVTTIELSEEMADIAEENIKKAGLSDKIRLIRGDAREILPQIDGEFDLIFVDAAKGQYAEFFKESRRLLKKGGIMVSDNVLYKGMTATDELLVHRKITLVRRLRAYLEMLKENKDFSTALIPIGDGVALSFKKI